MYSLGLKSQDRFPPDTADNTPSDAWDERLIRRSLSGGYKGTCDLSPVK